MGEKIFVGPIGKGLRNDVTPFNVDNDAFPELINAYQWRSKIKRKRGTGALGRCTRFVTVSVTLSSGSVNLITALNLEASSSITPGSLSLVGGTDGTTYTYLTLMVC